MVLLGEQIKGRKNVKKDSPYPQSDIVKYKDFQRAENKMDGIYIEFLNTKDEAKKEILRDKYAEAYKKWIKEAKKLSEKGKEIK